MASLCIASWSLVSAATDLFCAESTRVGLLVSCWTLGDEQPINPMPDIRNKEEDAANKTLVKGLFIEEVIVASSYIRIE
jgi:hypothetical protein